ncbi:Biopolymer transport protein exbD [Delftia tsuruhatensis]|uniref:ExbD/TolR family protein n=1 Tax=Delftia tsuruhatensis TaxID=180282 RepID=UPI001E77CD68|nr:biopolymer transporter ExbD [Delftia tsuruhatensis]CAB5705708.1 Biopolymer transport protein exbD [Delftia tsuruhatensis]CAC9693798.1 Biopolymer transport protein exbD [Delftia tsuruhatensis]
MSFGRLASRQGPSQPLHAINVTPLVDVMLVLVVIFILAAPMLAASLRVQLPQAQGTQPMAAANEDDALLLEVDAGGALWVQGQSTTAEALRERLARLGARNPQAELQLRADQAVPYGRVAELMGWAHAAGLTRMGFVAEPVRARPPEAGAGPGPSSPQR